MNKIHFIIITALCLFLGCVVAYATSPDSCFEKSLVLALVYTEKKDRILFERRSKTNLFVETRVERVEYDHKELTQEQKQEVNPENIPLPILLIMHKQEKDSTAPMEIVKRIPYRKKQDLRDAWTQILAMKKLSR